MPTPNSVVNIPILVPLGEEFKAVDDAIPDLKAHLRRRFPEIQMVLIRLKNPVPSPDSVEYATYLHEAYVVIVFTGITVATRVIDTVTDGAIKFLKRRAKRVEAKKKHVRRRPKKR